MIVDLIHWFFNDWMNWRVCGTEPAAPAALWLLQVNVHLKQVMLRPHPTPRPGSLACRSLTLQLMKNQTSPDPFHFSFLSVQTQRSRLQNLQVQHQFERPPAHAPSVTTFRFKVSFLFLSNREGIMRYGPLVPPYNPKRSFDNSVWLN